MKQSNHIEGKTQQEKLDYLNALQYSIVLKKKKDKFSLIIPELSLVVLNENRPSGIAIVTKTGKFNAIIEVPRDGYYSVGLMNYVKTYNAPENRLIAKTG